MSPTGALAGPVDARTHARWLMRGAVAVGSAGGWCGRSAGDGRVRVASLSAEDRFRDDVGVEEMAVEFGGGRGQGGVQLLAGVGWPAVDAQERVEFGVDAVVAWLVDEPVAQAQEFGGRCDESGWDGQEGLFAVVFAGHGRLRRAQASR